MNTRTKTDLSTRIPQLQKQIADLQSQLDELCHELRSRPGLSQLDQRSSDREKKGGSREEDCQKIILQQAQRVVSKHVGDLKRYNGVKDAAMRLLEVLAQQRGMRLKDVLEERDVDCKV